jgi:mono/diheme cytochrome c family protein
MSASRDRLDDEQRSYSAVFLLTVGLLLVGAVWAVWDDNISRRPWKKYQAEFSVLQIERAREALAKEDERLAADPEYLKAIADLTSARESLETGESAARLRALGRQRTSAEVRVEEEDLRLRIVKSKLEEAWYEYEHALLTNRPADRQRAHMDALEKEQVGIEAALAAAEAARDRIVSEIDEIRSVEEELHEKIRGLAAERERLKQRLDNIVLSVGPFEVPRIPRIEQVVLGEFDRNAFDQPVERVDRCASCHAAIDKAGFEDEPNPFKTHPGRDSLLAHHPIDQLGCTPCHGGQGPAVNSVEQAHGNVKFWEHPLLPGSTVQASCIECHADVRVPGAETIARGEQLFEQVGCIGCHLVEGYGELPKVGPYLRRIGAKADPDWLVEWIENPHAFQPRTKMPNFEFTRQEATMIAAYLLDASKDESTVWLAGHTLPAGIDPRDAALVAEGKALADGLGCRGCHGFAPEESPALLGANKDIAPNLARVAEKTNGRWIYHWLKNPRDYSPVSRMPSLRLSDQEARALTSYLLTLGNGARAEAAPPAELSSQEAVRTGASLIRKYGCAGCHDIPGMETESRIGVELSTFGSKTLDELFFGNRIDIPHTWRDWTYNKLKTPRTYATERIEQIMPQFDLAPEDIEALIVFLTSRVEGHIPERYRPQNLARERTLVEGRRLVERYNCIGCHVMEGRGGAILARYEESPTMAPPVLDGEGAKVQPNWLFGFLHRPVPLRPWLEVRMPTFGLSEAERDALVNYFLAQSSVEIPFVFVDPESFSEEYVEAGRLLATPDYFNCFSCHQQGDRKPEGPKEGWAPDLALARERLNPQWILDWLRNPQALQPGTKMPAFYDFSDPSPDGPDDVLGGDDERQVEALRDYVLSLGAAPVAEPVLAAPMPAPAPVSDENADADEIAQN